MLKFYNVDNNYTNYLQQFDRQVPNIKYNTNNKFVCGIVLSINGYNYYAPISHLTDVKRTSLPIFDHGRIVSTIRFSFMFPAPMHVLSEMDISNISLRDPNYANLLRGEYNYCRANDSKILNKAQQVYRIGCNSNHRLHYTCCKFLVLEKACDQYTL